MEMPSNLDWENPYFYQSLAEASDKDDWLAVRDQLNNASSPKVIAAFVEAMSDPDWLNKGHVGQSLEGIEFIPKSCPNERYKVVKAIAESGAKALVSREAEAIVAKACDAKDWDLVIEFLSITGPVTLESGNTAFHLIAEFGTPEQIAKACDCLLQQGRLLDAKNRDGKMPIHAAARNANPKAVEQLFLRGADLNAKDENGYTPLMEACQLGNMKTVFYLLGQGADLFAIDSHGRTPMHFAAQGRNPRLVERLAAFGLDIHAKDYFGNIPLHYAASASDNEEVVKQLIKFGANPDARNRDGNTPLFDACRSNSCMLALLQAGANVNAQNNSGRTPLHQCAAFGNSEGCEQLVKLGANLDARDSGGNTPLFATAFRSNSCMLPLLQAGANVNAQNAEGETPLHRCVLFRNRQGCEQLLQFGADPNLTDKNGEAPLHSPILGYDVDAFGKGGVDIIEILVKGGADINAKNRRGVPLILEACSHTQHALARVLVNLGASMEVCKEGLYSPLMQLLMNESRVPSEDMDAFIAADGGFTAEILERKLLAHRFGLKGTSTLANSQFQLEGFKTDLVIRHLQVVVGVYYAELKAALTSDDNARWADILSTLSPSALESVKTLAPEEITKILDNTASAISDSLDLDKIISRKQQGLPVGIAVGIPRHALGMALYNERLARCDRGGYYGDKPGILVGTIGNSTRLEDVLKECHSGTSAKFFRKDIEAELGLKDERYLPQKLQKVGNCTVANTNSMELALLYLQFEPLIGPKAAEELSRAIMKGRTKDTRLGSLEDYLNWHKKPRKLPPDLGLIRQLYWKQTAHPATDRQVQDLIRKWVEEQELGINPDDFLPEVRWYR